MKRAIILAVLSVSCGTGTYIKGESIHKPIQTIATIVWNETGECDVIITLKDNGLMRYHESKDSDNCNKLSLAIPVATGSVQPEREVK